MLVDVGCLGLGFTDQNKLVDVARDWGWGSFSGGIVDNKNLWTVMQLLRLRRIDARTGDIHQL